MSHLLNLTLFFPAVGAAGLLFIPRRNAGAIRAIALATTLASLLTSIPLVIYFSPESSVMQFGTDVGWIDVPPIRYHVGLDGISLFLVLLTTFLGVLCVLISWHSIEEHRKKVFFLLLLLEMGTIGIFASLDLFLFYVFWESTLVPLYLLIVIWGGRQRIDTTLKSFLYIAAGSLLMLVGIIWLYVHTGTFDYTVILASIQSGSIRFSPNEQILLFLAFFAAFAIRVPLFPFHTWLPKAHAEAPTAGSVLLAGVLLQTGAYGLMRFCLPLFPIAAHALAPAISALAIIGIIYGSLIALVQPELKKLIAYCSVAQMGFIVLGIFSFNQIALVGATYQMVSRGLTTGVLFLLVGMLNDRLHTTEIRNMGGLTTSIPLLASVFLITTLSSIGLPVLNNFVGEFLILLGVFQYRTLPAVLGAMGLLLSAACMLWMYQRVFFGELPKRFGKFPKEPGEVRKSRPVLPDLTRREKLLLIPSVIVMLWMGIGSSFFLRRMELSTEALLRHVGGNELRVDRADDPVLLWKHLDPKASNSEPLAPTQPASQPIRLPGCDTAQRAMDNAGTPPQIKITVKEHECLSVI
jgi:NADH-quinone oxidoreductase subunit M